MMYRFIAIILSLLFAKTNGYNQWQTQNINKQAIISFENVARVLQHNSIKPVIITDSTAKKPIEIQPIFSSLVSSVSGNGVYFQAGTRVLANPSPKYFIEFTATDQLIHANNYENNKFEQINLVPGSGFYVNKFPNNWYHSPLITGSAYYMPVKYLQLSGGYNKHFLGHGYRSFFISDNAPAYSYANVCLTGWKLKYLSMVTYMPDVYNQTRIHRRYPKYGFFHYLSLEITKHIEINFFESVISGGNDSGYYRSLEPAYLNPFIFMRPVEYSIASPDNVNIGVGLSIRLSGNSCVYSQFLLDEFFSKYAFKSSNWWGNKYAIQAGFKIYNTLFIKGLYFQFEYNQAQPYTFSHRSGLTNYGYNLHPLAHPLGANFREYITVLQLNKQNWIYSIKILYAQYGADLNYNAGINIYKNNVNRLRDLGVFIGQGNKTNQILSEFKIARVLNKKYNMQAELGGRFINIANNSGIIQYPSLFFGFRTLLYNNEIDY